MLLIATVALVTYGTLHDATQFLIRVATIKGYLWNHFLDIPTFQQFLLSRNVQIYLPIIVSGFFGFSLLIAAHVRLKTKVVRRLHHILAYILVAPYITSTHWLAAFTQEMLGMRRRWR